MLSVNPVFVFEESDRKRSSRTVLNLALVAACSLLWAGCNTLPQAVAPSTQGSHYISIQHISIQPTLPGADVGSSYHAVLSVSGGLAPYYFAVSQGQLPPGLTLNPRTGSISGTPTQAGTFAFAITVRGGYSGPSGVTLNGEPFSSSGLRTYALTVASSNQAPTIQISPANPSVAAGGKLQFAAVVSNTSNTAVTWSASAGTISANGLFTAPASTGKEEITVTAASAADSAVQVSTTATITASAFTITTSSIPSAVEGTAYSTTLTASGGQPPYQWSISSGSLPAGLQLEAITGTLSGTASGTATQSGTFTFSVRSTDSASRTAQQGLSLLVSTSTANCGPPAYGCSRTDQEIVQVPSTPPNVGSLKGANTIVTDPDFGNSIVRITDANTNPSPTFKNRTYVTSGGSADANLWNVDSSLFVVEDTGANSFPFTFDATKLQADRMYVSNFPTTNGLTIPATGDWSRVNPNILYIYSDTAINKYDFTDRTMPPSPQLVYDFTSSHNCLPAGFTETWTGEGGVSSDDTVFGMAYSNAGNQGTGVYVVAYKAGSGCSVLNTQTGQVGGDWGSKGTINIADRWTIHNAKLSKDGNWMVIVATSCLSSTCVVNPYFWQIGTTNVGSCGQGPHCSGHWTEGYTHWVNNNTTGNQVSRLFSEPTTIDELTPALPSGLQTPLDEHASWNNVDPADSLPFFVSFWSPISRFPAPWYNEITGVAADGSGKVWRFAHNFITSRSQVFTTEYGIGSVSQDGRFFIFSSDWVGTLGSESGASTCTVGTNCRGDVFVLQLN
jgi:hypothetical protein